MTSPAPEPIQALQEHLRQRIPPELAEVLLPAMTFSLADGHLRVVGRSEPWNEAFQEYALGICQIFLQQVRPPLSLILGEATPGGNSQEDMDGFLGDPGNRLALAACRRVIEAPGLDHNPLFLHGPAGCGKTHLLRAIAREFDQMLGPGAAVLMTGDHLVAQLAQDLASQGPSDIRRALDQATVVLLDGIEALTDRALAQEELFHVVNATLDRGAQLVVAGRLPPKRLQNFEDRLVSRLSWGLTVGIEPAQIETRLALVRRLAGRQAEAIPPDRLAAAVEQLAPDMAAATALAQRLNTSGALPEVTGRPAVSFERILHLVAEQFALRPRELAGKRRHREVVHARGLALLLGRELTGHSLKALGAMVGGRDHATVINAIRTTEERLAADAELRETLELLRKSARQ